MSLYLKHRPKNLDEVLGNQVVKDSIKNSLANHDVHHALLFFGETGTGKTTLARIVAMSLNCLSYSGAPCGWCGNCLAIGSNESPDYLEINAANMRGIDDVRAVIKNMDFTNTYLPNRVFVFDECHQWTNEAQNCILKVLEEPNEHSYIILCTTDPTKLLKTVRSRCEEYELFPLSYEDKVSLVKTVSSKEGITLEEATIDVFAKNCSSNPRELLTELSKLFTQDNRNTVESVISVLRLSTEVDEANGYEIAKLLMKKDFASLSKLSKTLDKSSNFEGMRRVILAYAKSCLIGKMPVNELALCVMNAFIKPLEDGVQFEDFVYRLYGLIFKFQKK